MQHDQQTDSDQQDDDRNKEMYVGHNSLGRLKKTHSTPAPPCKNLRDFGDANHRTLVKQHPCKGEPAAPAVIGRQLHTRQRRAFMPVVEVVLRNNFSRALAHKANFIPDRVMKKIKKENECDL